MKKRIAAALCALVMAFGSGGVLPAGRGSLLYAGASVVADPLGTVDIKTLASEKAVQLPSELMKYTSVRTENRQIYNEACNGIYFLNGSELSFLSLADGSYGSVYSFLTNTDFVTRHIYSAYPDRAAKLSSVSIMSNTITDSYECGGRLYLLAKVNWKEYYTTNVTKGYSFSGSMLCTYDLDRTEIVGTEMIPDSDTANYSTVGADSLGRIYLTCSRSVKNGSGVNVPKYYMTLCDSSLNALSETELPSNAYNFGAFDPATGNFCYESSAVMDGYNMRVLCPGNVGGNKLTVQPDYAEPIGLVNQYELGRHTSVIGGKYFCVDAPIDYCMRAYDIEKLPDLYSALVLTVERDYAGDSNGKMLTGANGSRTVDGFGSDGHFITVNGSTHIDEIDPQTGSSLLSHETAYPVFSLMRTNSDVIVVEKQGDSWYLQKLGWRKTTKLSLNMNSAVIDAGSSVALTAAGDGGYSETITWSTSNPKTASVSAAGVVYGTHAGTAVITAKNKDGITAKCRVTVRETALSASSGYYLNADGKAAVSSNVSANTYSYWAAVINSYMGEEADGKLVRAEHIGKEVIVEHYSDNGKTLLDRKRIADELPKFGALLFGKDNNYIVYAQDNHSESDDTAVLKIVKYSKDWKRQSAVFVRGINTYEIFDVGTMRLMEFGGKLYIYTCHEMYLEDNVHHQANMTFVLDESEMKIVESYYNVSNPSNGYISHSFNQFIRTDGKRIYRADHGDATPRAVSLLSSDVNGRITKVEYTKKPFTISGVVGDNYTGISLGGFELSTDNCLIAGNTIDQSDFPDTDEERSVKQRNIFVSVTSKTFGDSKVVMLTDYPDGSGVTVGTPHLVRLDDESFMVLWEETAGFAPTVVKVCTIDGEGTLTSPISTLSGVRLSDCQPAVYSDGLVKWYVTDSGTPRVYALNPFAPDRISEYAGSDDSSSDDSSSSDTSSADDGSGVDDTSADDNSSGGVDSSNPDDSSTPDQPPKRMAGDVNDSGFVDIDDIARLQQYLAGWNVSINSANADVTGDNAVDIDDIALLQQYLAGWKVKLI